MRNIITLLILALFINACKKDARKMKYKARFTTAVAKPPKPLRNDTLHTLFGNYITSLTPSHLSAQVNMFVFQDYYNQMDPSCHMISFIENNVVDVDFSNNAEIEFTPILHSTDIVDQYFFEQKETDFRFISFLPNYFSHEFDIPVQYKNIVQNSSNFFLQGSTFEYDSIQNRLKVKTSNNQLSYGAIHGNANGMPTNFWLVFGQTDTSYIYMYNGTNLAEDKRFPFWNQKGVVTIRSSQFNTQKVIMPSKGQTNTMYATLSYDTDNLIQVYTGNDMLPYTNDDVFVYAPHFWDRITIKLETINE